VGKLVGDIFLVHWKKLNMEMGKEMGLGMFVFFVFIIVILYLSLVD
jgi:hypothetical protein